MRKKLMIIVIIVFSISTSAQDFDTRTQNQAKAKFMAAENYFKNGNYNDALLKINEIEKLLNGYVLPSSQNLKIKILVKQDKFKDASKALYILEGLELNDDIMKDMANYSETISKGIEKEKILEKKKKERENALLEAYKYFKHSWCSNDEAPGTVFDKRTCRDCKGNGETKDFKDKNGNYHYSECGSCDGKGIIYEPKNCPVCKGKGIVLEYFGKYKFSKSDINTYISNNRTKIENYIKNKN